MFVFLPISCSELLSSLNHFYPKCVSWHRTMASLGSLLAMQNLIQYSRRTKSEFGYLQDPQVIQYHFQIWVLSKKARERSKVRNSTRFCYLLVAFYVEIEKEPKCMKCYIDNIDYSFIEHFVYWKNNGNLENWIWNLIQAMFFVLFCFVVWPNVS